MPLRMDFEGDGCGKDASPLQSDAAFTEFVRTQQSPWGNASEVLSKDLVDEVLADKAFVADWRAMLQRAARDRPTAAEVLERATWTPRVVVVTLHSPEPPISDTSVIACTSMAGMEIMACTQATHGNFAALQAALAEKFGVGRQEVRLVLPCGALLQETHDGR